MPLDHSVVLPSTICTNAAAELPSWGGVDDGAGEGGMESGTVTVPPQIQNREFEEVAASAKPLVECELDRFGRKVIRTEKGLMVEIDGVFQLQKRPPGRPRKDEILGNTAGKRGVPGRPPGEKAAMEEFKARLLSSPKSIKVLEKIFEAALDDDHKNQGVAWKLIVDRLAPLSSFEKGSGGKSQITINIGGLGESNVIEGEYES